MPTKVDGIIRCTLAHEDLRFFSDDYDAQIRTWLSWLSWLPSPTMPSLDVVPSGPDVQVDEELQENY